MTPDEARKVGRIACSADGGCEYCAEQLIASLTRAFPDNAESFDEAYEEEWPADERT